MLDSTFIYQTTQKLAFDYTFFKLELGIYVFEINIKVKFYSKC